MDNHLCKECDVERKERRKTAKLDDGFFLGLSAVLFAGAVAGFFLFPDYLFVKTAFGLIVFGAAFTLWRLCFGLSRQRRRGPPESLEPMHVPVKPVRPEEEESGSDE